MLEGLGPETKLIYADDGARYGWPGGMRRVRLAWLWPSIRQSRLDTLSLPLGGGGRRIEPPRGRPPPHFCSRRFCRSVCRRTKSLQKNRNVKGNFARGSYGGFSAGSRRNLGKFSAESRQVRGGVFASVGDEAFYWSVGSLCLPMSGLKASKGCRKGGQREANRLPGWRKIAETGAKRRPTASQNR